MSLFQLSEEQAMIQDLAKSLAQSEVKNYAADVDKEVRCPAESLAVLAEAGLIGAMAPEEFGGAGLDYVSHILAVEEVAKVCGSTASVAAATTAGIEAILAYGTEAQKKSLLAEIIGGKMISAAIGEGEADSDPFQLSTIVKADGEGYVINGTKRYVANAGYSDYYVVVCAGEEGLSAFIVGKENPGVKYGRLSPKLGLRACVAGEVVLENCKVGKDAMLGAPGKGAEVIRTIQNSERFGMAAVAIGVAQGGMDEAIKYTNERVQFGKRISEFQNTQFVLAELAAKIKAGRMLLLSAAGLKDQGKDSTLEAAMAKLVCADIASTAARKCLQAMGGFGYTREYPIERMMRDAKMTEVYGGAAEVQKALIAKSIGVC